MKKITALFAAILIGIGNIVTPMQVKAQALSAPDTTSDAFGYVLDASPAYTWIDTSGGTNASFTDKDDGSVGPIPIGFLFPFYENKIKMLQILMEFCRKIFALFHY